MTALATQILTAILKKNRVTRSTRHPSEVGKKSHLCFILLKTK